MRPTFSRGWGLISGTYPYTAESVRVCAPVQAHLIGSKSVVFDIDKARCLFSKGYFGKPVGIRKPKTTDIRRPIELSLLETMYLAEARVLEVLREGMKVSVQELRFFAREVVKDFDVLYNAYKELRDTGFIVRSALKYGADFAVYKAMPGVEHAPYLVKVLDYDQLIDPGDLIGWGRLSHSVRKELLLAIAYPSGARSYVTFKWLKP